MDKVWYYMKNNGQKIGPFNDEELVAYAKHITTQAKIPHR